MLPLNRLARGAVVPLVLALAALVYLGRPDPAAAHHLCPATGSVAGPFDIQTYEAANYRTLYGKTMELAATNRLFPDVPSFAGLRVETGERALGSSQTADPYIPPVILKSIAFLESGWAQGSYSPFVDYGEIGPVLSSHDCGYGILQVTSGMQNISGIPNLEQAMIGSHYAYNIARGARILAEKWNISPEFRPIIGNRDPTVIENWYYAIWGYNGWAFQNHPLNAAYSPARAPYSCGPTNDGFGHDRSQYPYQELVLGCVQRPASRAGAPLWTAQEASLPNLGDPKFNGPMNVGNWNVCSFSGQCAPMDIPTPEAQHRDLTQITQTRDQVIGTPSLALSATGVDLDVELPQTSAQGSFSVINPGTGVLGYRAVSTASWLRVSPSAGVALGQDLGGQGVSLQFTVNSGALGPGQHKGEVRVESLSPGTTSRTFEVRVTIRRPFEGQRQVGDFNGDGRDDIAFLCCADTMTLWNAEPAGTFAGSRFSAWPGYVLDTGRWFVGDFTGDGKDDLFHMTGSTALIWRSLGDGSFNVTNFRPYQGYDFSRGSWTVGDFDGDGRDDLVHACCGERVQTWFSNGDGTFFVPPFRPWPGYGTEGGSWRAGDFNGDGRDDLMHFCCAEYAHTWLSRGNGAYDIGAPRAWPGYGMNSGTWRIGDMNGDGKDDMMHICCPDWGHQWISRDGYGFDVLLFRPWPGYGMDGLWRTGDYNGDNRADLLHFCCPDYVHNWFGVEAGILSITHFRPWPGYGISSGSWEQGDFNGDGRTDLLHLVGEYAHPWISRGDGGYNLYMQLP